MIIFTKKELRSKNDEGLWEKKSIDEYSWVYT